MNLTAAARSVLVVSVAGLIVAGCGRAATPVPARSAGADVVPWRPLPAAHQYPQAPAPSPTSPIPVPAGTRPCVASQLESIQVFGGAAGGHGDTPVILRDRGTAPCVLQGYADVRVTDSSGATLAQAVGTSGRGTFFNDGPVVPVLLVPGTPGLQSGPLPVLYGARGQAWMNLEWYDCRQRPGSLLVVDLPGGAGRLSLSAVGREYSPVCDAPGHGNDSGMVRGPISPSGFPWPPRPQLLPVVVQILVLDAVRRGATLEYTVTLRNASSEPYVLDQCPDYVEILGEKQATASYRLNCAAAGTIGPGEGRVFAMRMNVPATLAAGQTRLSWSLLDGRLASPFATAVVTLR